MRRDVCMYMCVSRTSTACMCGCACVRACVAIHPPSFGCSHAQARFLLPTATTSYPVQLVEEGGEDPGLRAVAPRTAPFV